MKSKENKDSFFLSLFFSDRCACVYSQAPVKVLWNPICPHES